MQDWTWAGRQPNAEFDLFYLDGLSSHESDDVTTFLSYLASEGIGSTAKGNYVFVASQLPDTFVDGFPYPAHSESKGSPVFYIGKAQNAHGRFVEHLKLSQVAAWRWHNQTYRSADLSDYIDADRYMYAAAFGASVYWWDCPADSTPTTVESEMMVAFIREYGSLPICNNRLERASAA